MRRTAVLIDMDGTLADVSGIRHHVLAKPKRFDRFHAESVDCPANADVVAMAHEARAAGHAVLIVTARRHMWRHHTAWWLALHGVPSDAMFMRGNDDDRRDVEVKRDMLATIRRAWIPVLAIDDNPSIIALWESEDIPTVRVPGWLE